jgi:cytochrome c oxidase assembly factor CtaG
VQFADSWNFDLRVVALLALLAFVYVRGWIRIRRRIRYRHDVERLSAFLGGLALLYIAGESPLDAYDTVYLSAHMAQHLLLMMFAPGLILLGHPLVPMLRGLPNKVVKRVIAPLLAWPGLRGFFERLSSPPLALAIYAVSTIGWHTPYFYELALSSPVWHGAQHASFFWTGILFWWPVIRPGSGRSRWPLWVNIPYLVIADLLNTALSAFFIFSGRLLYPRSYAGMEDQALAGAIMWVPGSIVYLVPVVVITMRLLSPARLLRPERPLRRSGR